MLFSHKKIVLTGGAGGIGARVAQRLAAEGAELLIIARTSSETGPGRVFQGDLSEPGGIEAVAAEIARYAPHILINLAGTQYVGPMELQSDAQIHQNYRVNLLAPVLLTRAVLPAMKRRRSGQIVNIGSIFGSINYPHFSTYSSTKAGLHGFSEALRREIQGFEIDVTYIAPRAVRTGFHSSLAQRFAELTGMPMDDPDAVARQIVAAIAARRKDVFFGWREAFFVRLNGLLPRLVDRALKAETAKASALFAVPVPK